MRNIKRAIRFTLIFFLLILVAGYLLPYSVKNPVVGATPGDWNPKSFWAYPWGRSVVHKGVDIFARKGTNVQAATYGLVISSGSNPVGGNYLIVLGPKWRFHYYAHLQTKLVGRFSLVHQGEIIAKVGDSGNAKGKEPHLHYTIATPIPYPWRFSVGPQGYRKMFYLDPTPYLANR